MVQSVFPFRKPASTISPERRGRVLGIEIALPLTLLAIILLSNISPLLKYQLDHIVDWLCEHDFVFTVFEIAVGIIPIWMIGVIVYDRIFESKKAP